jgi:hypothetical protein
MKKKFKRLIAQNPPEGINTFRYVTYEDIKAFHGADWAKKFAKEHYGSTGGVIEKDGKQIFTIYYHDYERFADVIDKGIPTYFD